MVLYPSTLVIVSEERNTLCFKVGSFWSTFLLSPIHPQRRFQHFFGLLLPSPWVPWCSWCWQGLSPRAAPLPAGRLSRQRGVASYLPMRNTLPSYQSPGGKELAAKESKSLGGGRLACFCVVMLAGSLAHWLEMGAGTAPKCPHGGSASQAPLRGTTWSR